MFNLGFLAEGLSGFSGLGALTKAEREARHKTRLAATAAAKAMRTQTRQDHHAATKAKHEAAQAKRKADALERKSARKPKKCAGKKCHVLPEEEKTVDTINTGFERFKAAAQNALALGKIARTPAQRQAAAKAASDALAMVGSDMAAFAAKVGKPSANKLAFRAKQGAKKLRGFGGLTTREQIMDARANAAFYAMHPGGMRGLSMIDPVTGIDDGQPDYTQGPPTNIDYQTSGYPQPAGGMDPMMMMLMQQMNKPAELPKQCQRNMNKPICAIYTLSQESQKQMSFLITIVMQMMQQLMQMMQQLMAGGQVTGGGFGIDPTTGQPYPPPTMMPGFDQGGMPPPSFDPSAGMYPQAPSGGAYSRGGVEAIPPGFDVGDGGGGGGMPGGGEAFIPQDIPVSGGGFFTPQQPQAPTYAPGGDTYIQQEYNQPADIVQMPTVPDAGNLPQEDSDTAIVDEDQQMPRFQRATLPQMPAPVRQDLIEMAAGGAAPGPSQAQIQDSYFDDPSGGEGF